MPVDERTFVADVKAWVEAILTRRHDLPYGRAAVEEHSVGGRRRLDFTLYRRAPGPERVALTGEIKMPDSPQGRRGPLDAELVEDAFEKASRLGTPYYFTWTVRELALFQTHQPGVPFMDRRIEGPTPVADAAISDDVRRPAVETAIKDFWERFLERLAALERGAPLRELPLDLRFIRRIEASLEQPIAATLMELQMLYAQNPDLRARLNAWMRDEQGWELSEVPDVLAGNLERAARLSAYSLLNRLVFYEVLRRRFRSLPALVGMEPATRVELAGSLDRRFREAVEVSRDYETIFLADDFGSDLPFISDDSAQVWGPVMQDIAEFDFSRLDYDVIGRMYEQLISPGERRRYGQFYTSPDIVDLINAFCIRSADAKVMDPACGGGTFLVRAYARKRALAARERRERSHRELLMELFGVDIAAFPAQLSTINLAVRHLSDEPNYPQVVRKNFFEVRSALPFAHLPGGEGGAVRRVDTGELDAVVGNPPYIRQEEMGRDYKSRLSALVAAEWRGPGTPQFSGRSDIYVHFFAHGGAFVRPGGYVGLITSVGWLDTEYGFRLQEFFLQHFRIIAVIESEVDKWFEDARVNTVVTVLQREENEAARRANSVRFIFLKKPIGEIWSALLQGPVSDEAETVRQRDMDAVRDLIEEIDESQTTEYWRVRVLPQGDLWDMGCRVAAGEGEDGVAETGRRYRAGKWGQFLRAPDVWLDLVERVRHRMAPVSELAEVRRGFTSGVDKFFCVRDVTEQEIGRAGSAGKFRERWGIGRRETDQARIVRDGDGGLHLVEDRFLEPEFHRLTEAKGIVVRAGDVARRVVNASAPPAALRGTYLERYIRYGESRGWHEGNTVHARAHSGHWYDLGLRPKGERAHFFWSKSHQYRHVVPLNEDDLPANCNLYDVWTREGVEQSTIWAVLNSTIVALSKHQFGRPAGIEGALKTEVIDVNMMLVPDVRLVSSKLQDRLLTAARTMAERMSARMLPDEFEQQDRRDLDDATLEMLGFDDPSERAEFRERIYDALREQYGATRTREVVAQRQRARAGRRGASPAEMADELWDEVKEALRLLEFPRDFMQRGGSATRVDLPAGRIEVGQAMMETGRHLRAGTVRVGGAGGAVLDVGSLARAWFVAAMAECGYYGSIDVPDDGVSEEAVRLFQDYRRELTVRFEALARERTRDSRRQRAIAAALMRKALAWRRG